MEINNKKCSIDFLNNDKITKIISLKKEKHQGLMVCMYKNKSYDDKGLIEISFDIENEENDLLTEFKESIKDEARLAYEYYDSKAQYFN